LNIFLPYTRLEPVVRRALQAAERLPTEVYVGSADTRYYDLLSDLWSHRETFAIVEHDVIVRPDSLDELEGCPEPWCAFTVPYFVGDYPGLACTKFEASVMGGFPEAMSLVGTMSNASHPPKHWCTLDAFLMSLLYSRGFRKHVHEPALGHYREYAGPPQPTHNCHAVGVQ
jgi:hypothetical protein